MLRMEGAGWARCVPDGAWWAAGGAGWAAGGAWWARWVPDGAWWAAGGETQSLSIIFWVNSWPPGTPDQDRAPAGRHHRSLLRPARSSRTPPATGCCTRT